MSLPNESLKDKRLRYLKECEPKEYRRLQREGLLDEHLELRAKLCRQEHDRLLRTGETEIDDQAWSWAIRTQLLNSPMD